MIGGTLKNLAQAPFRRIEERITSIPDRFNNTATGEFLQGDFSRVTDPFNEFAALFKSPQSQLPGMATLTGDNQVDMKNLEDQLTQAMEAIQLQNQETRDASKGVVNTIPAEQAARGEFPDDNFPDERDFKGRRVTQESMNDITNSPEWKGMDKKEKLVFLRSRGIDADQFKDFF